MSVIVQEKDLPLEVSREQSVEIAYASELAEVTSKLVRGLPCLIECDKDLAPFVFINIRNRLRQHELRCLYLDGRPRPEDQQPAMPMGLIGTMIAQLREAVRGSVEKRVVVLPHLDLLTTSQGGLTAEAREVIPLLYENPELVWLGFKDPTFQIPGVISNLFLHHVSLLGIRRERLAKQVPQKASRKFGREFNPWNLYKHVSGVNPVRLNKLLTTLEGEDYPDDPKQAYKQLRQATLVGALEVPNVDLDKDIGGYKRVKERMRKEILDVLARRDTLTDASAISSMEALIPKGMLLAGPPGCLHADTPIYDPVDGTTLSVKKRYEKGKPFHVYSRTAAGEIVTAKAEKPWKYRPAKMVKLTFSSGRGITVTEGHRFWNGTDYQTVSLACEQLQESGPFPLPSISESALSVQMQGGQHLMRTTEDSQGHYSENCHLYDGQLQLTEDSVQSFSPSQVDAQQYTHVLLHSDGWDGKSSNSLLATSAHHSSKDCIDQIELHFEGGCEHLSDEESYGCTDGWCQPLLLHEQQTIRLRTTEELLQYALDTKQDFSQQSPEKGRQNLDYNGFDWLVKAEFAGIHPYYDFHVPEYENYWAEGLFHHNTGKTLFAKGMASAIGAAITIVSGPELKSKWVGESEENLRRIFYQARQSAPSIIVFDEIDSFATARGTYTGSGVEHSMVNQLLTEMDGFHKEELVFVVGTTNFVESLDSALLRPGRFEFHLHIPYPEAEDRREILKIYDGKMKLRMTEAALEAAVKRTNDFTARGSRFSGDDINALCRSIARIRLREGKIKDTTAADVEQALTEWIERPKMTAAEENVLATHEAGHAVAAMYCKNAPPIERITIQSEMQWAFGYVRYDDPAHKFIQTKGYLEDLICVALAARESEQLLLGDLSVGASSDLASATGIAREMVEVLGLGGDNIGVGNFRNRDGTRIDGISAKQSEMLDKAIANILETQRKRAIGILKDNRKSLECLRDLLLKHKTIDSKQLKELM